MMKHMGKFTISDLMLKSMDFKDGLFNGVIVLEATRKWENYCTEYFAISEHFDELSFGEAAPEYKYDDGKWSRV